MPPSHVLAIDQGTTSTRAVVYDRAGSALGSAALELTQYYPRPGWVEHDPEEIWRSVAAAVPQALAAARVDPRDLAAIGLTNQRETVVVWDRATGEPLDVYVNGTLIAHGEVVVVNDKFGIRLTDVISPAERIRKLK